MDGQERLDQELVKTNVVVLLSQGDRSHLETVTRGRWSYDQFTADRYGDCLH